MKKNFHFSYADSQAFTGIGEIFSKKKVFEKFGGWEKVPTFASAKRERECGLIRSYSTEERSLKYWMQ